MKLRPAFTMIELVFVIVILGILAAIAIPKVSASRIDAKAVAIRQDIGTFTQAFAAMRMSQGLGYQQSGGFSWYRNIGINDVSTINKKNWVYHGVFGSSKPIVWSIYSTLAMDGGTAKSKDAACVFIRTKASTNDRDVRSQNLIVEIKDSPVCNRIGAPGVTDYGLDGKEVKF